MFSQTAEYALRAVVCLADHPDQPMTTQQIADATKVPAGYLSKVLQSLARADVVHSQRGTGGGFTLVTPPGELTVLQVINAVDPLKRIDSCPLGLETHGSNLCPLHKRLDNAIGMVEDTLRDATIALLLSEPTRSHPLCETVTATVNRRRTKR